MATDHGAADGISPDQDLQQAGRQVERGGTRGVQYYEALRQQGHGLHDMLVDAISPVFTTAEYEELRRGSRALSFEEQLRLEHELFGSSEEEAGPSTSRAFMVRVKKLHSVEQRLWLPIGTTYAGAHLRIASFLGYQADEVRLLEESGSWC